MAHIKTILVDDFGQEYSVHNYDLGSGLMNLTSIESKVEELRPEILGDLSCDLLELEQSSSSEKKTGVDLAQFG
jgi:hypothetical protein